MTAMEGSSKREKRRQARRLLVLSDAQVAMGWFVILSLAALVGAVYLSQASRIASGGRTVQLLQNELERLKRENAELERNIAEAQTLERLQQESARLGFVLAAPEDIEFLVVAEYPVAPPSGELSLPVPSPPVETIGEAVWLAFRGSLSDLMKGQAGEN